MSIIGADLGYTYTKTSDMVIFPSKYTEVQPLLGGRKLKIDGSSYYVGDGNGTVELNKIDSDVTKVCLFYALGKSRIDANGVKLVTGLPIAQYQKHKDEFKKMLLDNRYKTIAVDDSPEKRIYIDDVKIYPQGAGALYGQNVTTDAIVVDIGGRTVDIAYFSITDNIRKLEKSGTLYSGTLALYSEIASTVNARYDLSLNENEAQRILTQGLTINGESQDVLFLKPVLSDHIKNICEHIRVNYPANTTPIYLCGGGALLLQKVFEQQFKNIKMLENSQFANALGFKRVGEAIWQKNQ